MYYRRVMAGLQSRVVLVTGGSGGLGRALGRAFARQHHRVILSGRNEAKLKTAADEVSRDGGEALPIVCDITDTNQIQRLAETIGSRWGNVEILINNAGVAKAASFLDTSESLWEEILKTNLTGTYHCCKQFLPAMIEAHWGRIINIGSTTSKVAYPHVSAYVSSKHGLLGLTRVLALETARLGITVNAICPGYLDDELTHANAQQMAQKTGKSVEQILEMFASSAPQKRLIAPEEVAELALLMASDKLAGMTGQAISIDGGATMV
jgi:3-hydroxybutyrate dehydrogenase